MDNYLKKNINIKKQSIQLGSSHIIKSEQKILIEKILWLKIWKII